MSLKDNIKALRKSKNLTQVQLGKLVNKSSQVISNWERGYTSSINQDDISKLASALSVEVSDLLKNSDEHFNEPIKEITEKDKKPTDLNKFLNKTEIMFDGEIMKLDSEDRQKLRNALEFIFYEAKKKNKRKK